MLAAARALERGPEASSWPEATAPRRRVLGLDRPADAVDSARIVPWRFSSRLVAAEPAAAEARHELCLQPAHLGRSLRNLGQTAGGAWRSTRHARVNSAPPRGGQPGGQLVQVLPGTEPFWHPDIYFAMQGRGMRRPWRRSPGALEALSKAGLGPPGGLRLSHQAGRDLQRPRLCRWPAEPAGEGLEAAREGLKVARELVASNP